MRATGLIAITITSILWGTTGTAATFAPAVSPLGIGAAALGIGGLLQALIALPALRAAAPALRARLGVIVIGALAVLIYPLAFYSSMHVAGVAIGSVVSLASAPVASGILERIIDGRRLSRWWMLAVSLGVLGSVVLCAARMTGAGDGAAGPEASATLLGVALGLAAGASYATYSWACHRLMADGIGRAAAMGSVFGLGGLALMPVLALTGGPVLASGTNLAVAAYMALVPMFAGYVLFGIGLARVPASTATTITLTEPAVATALAVAIVGERLSPAGWAGLAIIAAVMVILAIAPASTPAPRAAHAEEAAATEQAAATERAAGENAAGELSSSRRPGRASRRAGSRAGCGSAAP